MLLFAPLELCEYRELFFRGVARPSDYFLQGAETSDADIQIAVEGAGANARGFRLFLCQGERLLDSLLVMNTSRRPLPKPLSGRPGMANRRSAIACRNGSGVRSG